jgi:hypothetical protein
MDAATLFVIWVLKDGREAVQPSRQFPTVSACEQFIAEAEKRRPADLPPVRYECWRHYRVSS